MSDTEHVGNEFSDEVEVPSISMNPLEELFLPPSLSNHGLQSERDSAGNIELTKSSSSAPSAPGSTFSSHQAQDTQFAGGNDDLAAFPREQSSLTFFTENLLSTQGTVQQNIFQEADQTQLPMPTDYVANPVLKGVTDAALESDLLELISGPITLSTPACDTLDFPGDNEPFVPHDQGETAAPGATFSLGVDEPFSPSQSQSRGPASTGELSGSNDSKNALHMTPVSRTFNPKPAVRRERPFTGVFRIGLATQPGIPLRAADLSALYSLSHGARHSADPALSLPTSRRNSYGPTQLEQMTTFDTTLRERSLAIFLATEEQMKRPMKKSRTYSKAVPSRFCHICTRQSKKSSPHAFCLNINRGTCRKAVCEKCFIKFGWDWEAVSAPGSQWLCPHCCNICPQGAQCYNYVRLHNELVETMDSIPLHPTDVLVLITQTRMNCSLLTALFALQEKSNDHRPKSGQECASRGSAPLALELPTAFAHMPVVRTTMDSNLTQPSSARAPYNGHRKGGKQYTGKF
jgi:hypothetical protein